MMMSTRSSHLGSDALALTCDKDKGCENMKSFTVQTSSIDSVICKIFRHVCSVLSKYL